jgi:hypothetical protein
MQKIPKCWIWAYWICPSAWSLNGFLASQYGDMEEEIIVNGERKAINAFIQGYFGYYYDDLDFVAIVLFAIPLAIASAFACAIAKLNFERR